VSISYLDLLDETRDGDREGNQGDINEGSVSTRSSYVHPKTLLRGTSSLYHIPKRASWAEDDA
jgi:hypothetical protein